MGAKQQYLSRLDDGRNVWLNGSRVSVANHPAFQGTVHTFASMLELQDDPQFRDGLTFLMPNGVRAHLSFLVPGCQDDLFRRREAFRIWSERTFGVMSRLSEYSRSLLTGWYASRHKLQDKEFAEKIEKYYLLSCENDWLSTVASHDPQMNRSKLASELDDPDVVLRVVRETEDGVIVRGAKMIATAAPYVDEVLIFPYHPRKKEEAAYAGMFAVAVNTPGLHVICREPFVSDNAQDHPVSAKFDEMDAVLIFDDALIPWERVFIKNDPEALLQLKLDPVASGLSQHQTVVRLISKLEFIAAIGMELAAVTGADRFPHVQEKLGELIIQLETVKGLLVAAEHQAKPTEDGIWLPYSPALQTARNLGTRYYPRALEILQQIGAGGFFQLPSKLEEFNGPIGKLLQKYYRGADRDAFGRAKLFKLAWDLVGSPLASRHELYERFYSGDPVRTYAAQYADYDKKPLLEKVWNAVRSF